MLGKISDKRISKSIAGTTYFLVIEKQNGERFNKSVSPSTYRAKKVGGPWHYFERTQT